MIAQGLDPVAERQAMRTALVTAQAKAITFAEAARRCHTARAAAFSNAKHRKDWISSLERYAFPVLGTIPVARIELPHIMEVLEPIWLTRTESATRVRQRIEAVITWATVSGYRSGENPARWEGNLKEVLAAPRKVAKEKHFPALPWHDVPAFMVDLREAWARGRWSSYLDRRSARAGARRDEFDLGGKLRLRRPRRGAQTAPRAAVDAVVEL